MHTQTEAGKRKITNPRISLTPEQDRRIQHYQNRWLRLGLKTGPCDRQEAERWIREGYRVFGFDPPRSCIWLDSPSKCQMVCTIITCSESLVFDVIEHTREIKERHWKRFDEGTMSRTQHYFKGWSLSESLLAVGYSIVSQVESQAGERMGYFCGTSCWNTMEMLGFLGLLEFCSTVLDMNDWSSFEPWARFAENAGWWHPLKGIAILFERPAEMWVKDGYPHRDGGPAVVYPDGWSLWFLNGVEVPREVAETPGDRLDPQRLLRAPNAGVRQEIVRKIGIDRVFEKLDAQVVDSWMGYELLMLDLKDGRWRPYLRIQNPSTGNYHLEGVHPWCKTVEDALNWRNGATTIPAKIT